MVHLSCACKRWLQHEACLTCICIVSKSHHVCIASQSHHIMLVLEVACGQGSEHQLRLLRGLQELFSSWVLTCSALPSYRQLCEVQTGT